MSKKTNPSERASVRRTNARAVVAALALALAVATGGRAQTPPPAPPAPPAPKPAADNPLLRKLDANGDGVIDDAERRAIREQLRARGEQPGARSPSTAVEQVGDRAITEGTYPSSDGRAIPYVLSLPAGDGPFPVVVTIHGGQGDRDLTFLRTMAVPGPASATVTALNERPWAVLAISYRAGDGALFGMEHDDVIAGIRFAKTLPKADPARVAVVGGSHGGHLALVAAEAMGDELCGVATGSPWLTDPLVYLRGDAAAAPMAQAPASARADFERFSKMVRMVCANRRLGAAESEAFLRERSLEANSHKIAAPTLFVTSRGDDQVPHVLVEPMIRRMQAAGQDVSVYTAEKSPHGFYWGRAAGAARALRGPQTDVEAAEEAAARQAILDFLAARFAANTGAGAAAPGKPVTPGGAPGAPATARPEPAQSAVDVAASVPPAPGRAAPAAPPAGGDPKRTPPVRLTSGQIVGERAGDVHVFRGIPYAAPPVGDLRWQPPQPPRPWTGVRDALAFGAPAPQNPVYFAREAQSEDCLFLNVWTPAQPPAGGPLPVLVWFHGGAFQQNSGAQPRYDGTELARRGVVVVTINYRLGPLGLFAHPLLTAGAAPDAPLGNYCLLDMIAALQWTRDHIAAFGGDPDNVAISGSSAGGTSCLFLMGIPSAHGLFHKAVIHSSGGIRNIQDLRTAEAAGLRLAEHLGFGEDVTIAQLRAVAADRVAGDIALVRRLELPVKPLIDGRLVTQVPEATFAQGKQARIPVLMGAANGESGARAFGDDIAPGGAFGFQRGLADDMVRAGQRVHLFQLTFVPPEARGNRIAAQHGESVAYAFGTIGPAAAAQHGFRDAAQAERAARNRRGGGAGGGRGAAARGGREDDGAPVEDSQQGRAISDAMMRYLVAFLRTGTPDADGLAPWPAYTSADPQTMVFGNHAIAAKKAPR
jgi:para-nitrobenzyl esterase